jgi:starch-binding outer membrane protein, SusD/RagB family
MKKIAIFITSAIACLSLGSCTSILDQKPLDSFTDEAVWSDLNLSEAYLNMAYNEVRGYLSTNTLLDNFSEETYHKHGYGTNNMTHCLMSPDAAYLSYYDDHYYMWSYYYSYINTINTFLKNIDGVPADTESDIEWRNELKGQGYYLRAWFYSLLYTFFGRIVIVDEPYELDSEYTKTRQDMDTVADFIVGDCDKAADLLPLEYSDDSDHGRATKGAALALKSRVLLYKASPLYSGGKDKTTSARWQAASDAAKAVIDLGVYSLVQIAPEGTTLSSPEDVQKYYEDYAALFYDADSPEFIWEKIYNPNYENAWSDTNSTPMGMTHRVPCGPGNGFEGWGTFDPTQNLVSKIQKYDGTPQDPYTDNTVNPWQNLEIRYWANILGDGSEWGYGDDHRAVETFIAGDESVVPGLDSSEGEYWWNASNTGYAMRKSYSPDFDSYGTQQWDAPWVFIRLSEIYLNYAECQLELGNDPEALKYINMVRNRALLPDATGDVRAALEYEREVELMFEGTRFTDMRRWMRMDEEYANPVLGCKVTKYADGHKEYDLNVSIDQREWKGDKYYWLPLSRSEYNKSPKYLDLQPYE